MKTINDIRDFLDNFLAWVSAREDVQAVALVGSYAGGEARDDSDIDLCSYRIDPQRILKILNGSNASGLRRNIRPKIMLS